MRRGDAVPRRPFSFDVARTSPLALYRGAGERSYGFQLILAPLLLPLPGTPGRGLGREADPNAVLEPPLPCPLPRVQGRGRWRCAARPSTGISIISPRHGTFRPCP